MTQEVLKLALEALETELSIDWTNNDEFNASAEKMYEAITAIKEALAKEKALQALHSENERLGLYKDAYAQPKPQIKTTDPFESSRVGDYNRGWNDCLFASGIVKQPEPLEKFCDSNCVWTDHHPDCKLAQPQQEPVAVVDVHEFYDNCANFSLLQKLPKGKHTLYTTPPQRTWVGLTVNEIALINADYPLPQGFARAIEAKLKERNG
jgi:hypothetical protein